MPDVLIRLFTTVIACGAALVAVAAIHHLLVRLGRRLPIVADLTRRTHRPALPLVLIIVLGLTLREAGWPGLWRGSSRTPWRSRPSAPAPGSWPHCCWSSRTRH